MQINLINASSSLPVCLAGVGLYLTTRADAHFDVKWAKSVLLKQIVGLALTFSDGPPEAAPQELASHPPTPDGWKSTWEQAGTSPS